MGSKVVDDEQLYLLHEALDWALITLHSARSEYRRLCPSDDPLVTIESSELITARRNLYIAMQTVGEIKRKIRRRNQELGTSRSKGGLTLSFCTDAGSIATRSVEEVFEDHLRLRLAGSLEEDLRRNYAEDVVLLTVNSNVRGHDAIRMSARRLREQLPDAHYEFQAKQVNGPWMLLIWRGWSSRFNAAEGADSFNIRNRKIRFQSIHYGLEAPWAPSPSVS